MSARTATVNRITPAYAGKSVPAQYIENIDEGSPPRMRGKVQHTAPAGHTPGITPAYAGKSRPDRRADRQLRDHPRVCGEKNITLFPNFFFVGSPPRMRGKASRTRFNRDQTRITPAYAGKRWGCATGGSGCWDHPRVCGEKPNRILWDDFKAGSPPRMRGKGKHNQRAACDEGITPAYAGKRTLRYQTALLVRDHPRVCGEKQSPIQSSTTWEGSPPRMRGKETWNVRDQTKEGITPAYAGKRQSLQAAATS